MLRVCRARQCIARHAELVLSATVSYATAYHGSLGHTDGGVILSSSTAHALLRLLRTCAISALQLAVCRTWRFGRHPLLSKQVLASATRLSKSRRAQACRASERCRRREPDLAQGAAQDPVAISQPSAATPFDPASFHATNFTRAQSAQRTHSPLQRQRVRDLVPCTRVVGFPSFALQSPSNASMRGVFHLKLASRHA